jgi:hypothetical protein
MLADSVPRLPCRLPFDSIARLVQLAHIRARAKSIESIE